MPKLPAILQLVLGPINPVQSKKNSGGATH